MFNSIRRRLIISYLFLTLFTVATLGIVGIGLAQRYAARQEQAFLNANAQAIARQAARYIQTPGGQAALQSLTQSSAFLGDMDVRVFDRADQLLAVAVADSGTTQLTWLPRAGAEDGNSSPVLIFNLDIEQQVPTAIALDNTPGSIPNSPTERADPNQLRPRESGGDPAEELSAPDSMTVRRTPSFWGHRLIFESRPGMMQNHHAQMLESQVPAATVPGRPVAVDVGGRLGLARVASAPIIVGTGESAPNESAADNGTAYGYVTVSRAVSLQGEPLAALRQVFVIAAAGAIGLAAVVGWAVSRGLTAPIQQLAHTAGRMQAGDLTARAPVHSHDELGALASQFNRMADQLQSSFGALQQERDTLRRFVADASHELRTPMTALRTFTELLQGNAGNDADRRAEFLQESQAQLARLEWITRNLLDLSRLDAGVADLEMTPHDAAAWIESTTAAFQAQATVQQIDLVAPIPITPLPLTGDRARLEMALRNLIDNALKFTPVGGRVEVGVETGVKAGMETGDATFTAAGKSGEGNTLHIWVQDSGPGIDAADLPHIFERFYRSPRGRKEGSGLGLAITQSIAQAHGGRVVVASTPDAGSRFTLVLPLSPPAPDIPPA